MNEYGGFKIVKCSVGYEASRSQLTRPLVIDFSSRKKGKKGKN